MSQENVEIVRAIYSAFVRGDNEAIFEHVNEDVEWYEPPDVSGGALRRGQEGMRQSLNEWLGAWSDYRYDLGELIDAGEHVVAEGWQSGRGKGSGVEVSEEIFSVWTLRAGKVVRQQMFRDRAQALGAAGLSEQDAHADP